MTEKPKIRGLEKFSKPTLRGLGKFPVATAEKETPKLIPEGYDMPPDVLRSIEQRTTNPELEPFTDSEGVLHPGLVLDSLGADKKRLITNMYRTPRGVNMIAVHIEGEPGLRNLTLEDVRQRIKEGRLVIPSDATIAKTP